MNNETTIRVAHDLYRVHATRPTDYEIRRAAIHIAGRRFDTDRATEIIREAVDILWPKYPPTVTLLRTAEQETASHE